MQFALGLTNECNLAYPHCYRDVNGVRRLSVDQVRGILGCLPVRSANLGTGENCLHPDFLPIVEVLQAARDMLAEWRPAAVSPEFRAWLNRHVECVTAPG